MVNIVQFVALLLTARSMGVHFGTWPTERPLRRTKSGALFIEVHQGRDQVAARVMPILGNAAIIFLALGVFQFVGVKDLFAVQALQELSNSALSYDLCALVVARDRHTLGRVPSV